MAEQDNNPERARKTPPPGEQRDAGTIIAGITAATAVVNTGLAVNAARKPKDPPPPEK